MQTAAAKGEDKDMYKAKRRGQPFSMGTQTSAGRPSHTLEGLSSSSNFAWQVSGWMSTNILVPETLHSC